MEKNYKVCVLTSVIHNIISQEILSGILGRSLVSNVELTIVSAGGIKSSDGVLNSNISLYKNVLSSEKFDGIIVLAGSMSLFASEDELRMFLNSLPEELPLITIAINVPGFLSITIDNVNPLVTIVSHLVKIHHKKKLMFISGPEKQIEAQLRLSGYKKGLIKNNLEIDNNYIISGDFTAGSCTQSLKNFIDSGLEMPDAIVCVNDETALGVYSELKRNNISIGEKGILVTGFDNMSFTKTMNPCLTTVEQSFIKQGVAAVDNIVSIIEGESFKPFPETPKILFRKSCGCKSCGLKKDICIENTVIDSLNEQLDDGHIEGLEKHISEISNILKRFKVDINYNFISDIKPYIDLYKYKGYNLNSLLGIINVLGNDITTQLDNEGLLKFYKQIKIIDESIIYTLSHEYIKEFRSFNEQSSELDAILMELSSCMSFEDLEKVLNTNFYYLGIKDFSLVLPNSDNKYLKDIGVEIFTKDDSLNKGRKEYCTLYLPVSSKYETGYCRFNILLNSFHIGEVLSYQISRAIYLIELFDSLNSKIKAIDNSYKDLRITKDLLMENEQLANIGGLVAGFTHEISTPIGVSVTATSHMMDELKAFYTLFNENKIKKNDMSLFLKQSEDTIKILIANLNRTASLINGFKQISVDQASDIKRPFELGSYLQEIVSSLTPILRRGEHKVVIESEKGIVLNSYPGAISQIITNLIQNSVKHGFENKTKGEIVIKVINDIKKVTIIYSDNGSGIRPELQDKIFNTYYSTKIGKGGSGLGLSIIKKLTEEKLLGSISCSGSESEGAIFTIKLPH